ncbi:MAG TPA: hypothetical protein VN088_19075 [Nocardioides sp.]|nr:hypothetical protein [Nocardioides sp.]
MRIVNTMGARELQHDGVTYTRPEDEIAFEVPEPVGEHLVRFPHWVREYQADPSAASMAERLRALEAQAAGQQAPSDGEAALLARVAELEAQLAGLTTGTAPAKPAAKKAAAKKAAASAQSAGDETPGNTAGDDE